MYCTRVYISVCDRCVSLRAVGKSLRFQRAASACHFLHPSTRCGITFAQPDRACTDCSTRLPIIRFEMQSASALQDAATSLLKDPGHTHCIDALHRSSFTCWRYIIWETPRLRYTSRLASRTKHIKWLHISSVCGKRKKNVLFIDRITLLWWPNCRITRHSSWRWPKCPETIITGLWHCSVCLCAFVRACACVCVRAHVWVCWCVCVYLLLSVLIIPARVAHFSKIASNNVLHVDIMIPAIMADITSSCQITYVRFTTV